MSERRPVDNSASARSRVVVMVNAFPSLSETFVLDQIDGLIARGIDVHVVAGYHDDSGLVQAKGRRLEPLAEYAEREIRLPTFLPRFIRNRIYPKRLEARAYARLLRDAALVLCHFGPIGLRAARALKGNDQIRLWTIFHGYDISAHIERAGRDVYRPLFARGDKHFGVSRLWTAKIEALGCPPERIGLLRMGIEVKQIRFSHRDLGASGEMRFLTVSRLVEKKGTEFALRALAELKKTRPELRWRYKIIGEGRLRPSLERLSKELGISGRVEFCGNLSVDAVQDQLAESDLFILPSVTAKSGDMEGIPVSLMEAMASGVPVLSTYHSGIPELIDDGVSGLLSQERDYRGLARNICRLIDDEQLRSSVTTAARAKIENEFNQSAILDHLAAEIRNAIVT